MWLRGGHFGSLALWPDDQVELELILVGTDEATVGLLWSVKLGVNPGELLGFLPGWTTIDIYDDDLGHRKLKREAEQPDSSQHNSGD